ncbi:MAG TPA: hypothetical protein VFW27_30080 [Actinoplanes sp.]|nr:hypothetical protein [Actinoplanes sp.]
MPDVRMLEIAAEQEVVDRVYARLDVLREGAGALAREGHRRAAAGPATGLVERDALVHRAATRLKALDAEEEGLVFGRLDFDDHETYHIGRLGVRDGTEPLLIDWRAPAAAPFYRATTGDPLGVVRRRVIICAEGSRFSTSTTTSSPKPRPRTAATSGFSARGRCWPRCDARAGRTCATSSPPSSASRTRRSGRPPAASR